MKRAVLCVQNPENYIRDLENEYSLMIVDPNSPKKRMDYLLEHSDYSILVTSDEVKTRNGNDYGDERMFWYTSGTTGDSKFYGYTEKQKHIMTSALVDLFNITANDRYASIMPMNHAHGQLWYWVARHAGCEIKFFNMHQLKHVHKFNPTYLSLIPKISDVMTRFKFQDLRFIFSTSAEYPAPRLKKALEHFRVPIVEGFGMTEGGITFSNPLHGMIKYGTVGKPITVEAKLEDQKLFIKGPTVPSDGWIDTGDLATVDEDGYYTILGRSVDQINVNGIKVNPAVLETQVLENFVDVQQVSIFGNNCVKCIYIGDVDESTVAEFLTSLGKQCVPKLVLKVTTIPANDNGKVSRHNLSTLF